MANKIRPASTRPTVSTSPAAPKTPAKPAADLKPQKPADGFEAPKSTGANSVTLGSTPPAQASVFMFDAANADIRAFAQSKGWNLPNTKLSVTGDLVYTTDNWKTTKSAPLQYMRNGQQGFLLRDVPPGTKIEYAVHAFVSASVDDFRGYYDRGELWVNNGGRNYTATTGGVI